MANLDLEIDRKKTDSLKWDFAIEKKKDPNYLPLWVADMDFKLPEEVINPLLERVNHGVFGYTDPKDDYYDAVIYWFKKHYKLDINKNNIIVNPGVVFSICTLIKIITNESDSIIINEPVYYPFKSSIIANKREVVISNLIIKNGKYVIDYDDFEKKIKDNNVKVYILCNPHNPVGRVWDKEELEIIIDICKRNNVFIISDEIHSDFVFEKEFYSIKRFNYDNVSIVTGPTKTFNIPGLKISNTIVFNDDIKKLYLEELDRIGYSQQSALGIVSSIAAYKYGDKWLNEVRKYIYDNILYIESFIKDKLPKIKFIKPEGTYLIWLDFRDYNLKLNELEALIDKSKLWLDSGAIFGKQGAGFQRINVATTRKNINIMLNSLYDVFKSR